MHDLLRCMSLQVAHFPRASCVGIRVIAVMTTVGVVENPAWSVAPRLDPRGAICFVAFGLACGSARARSFLIEAFRFDHGT